MLNKQWMVATSLIILASTCSDSAMMNDNDSGDLTSSDGSCRTDAACGQHGVCVESTAMPGKGVCNCRFGYTRRQPTNAANNASSSCVRAKRLRTTTTSASMMHIMEMELNATRLETHHTMPAERVKMLSKIHTLLQPEVRRFGSLGALQSEHAWPAWTADPVSPTASSDIPRETPCPNLLDSMLPPPPFGMTARTGNKRCFMSGTCFELDSNSAHCICPPGFYGNACQSRLTLNPILNFNGAFQNATALDNRRFVHQRRKDGATLSRHFTSSLTDCVLLCLGAGHLCKSVNFGTINGAAICELITINPMNAVKLKDWIEFSEGWQHACCF